MRDQIRRVLPHRGSAAIFADALESIVNVTAATFAAYALVVAHRPADDDHPYGHGKIEFVSAGFEGGMICVAAGIAMAKAVLTLMRGSSVHQHGLATGLALLAVALLTNATVGTSLVRIGRRRSSLTLEADGKHLITDAVTSAAALCALMLIRATGRSSIDPVAAILVSLYIGYTGLDLVRRSAAGLMDAQDTHDAATITRILDAHCKPMGTEPLICSYHKLRHRHAGRYHWVDFHLLVPGTWHVQRAHEVASAIEHEIEQALGEGDATAHIEPCSDKTCDHCANAVLSAAM